MWSFHYTMVLAIIAVFYLCEVQDRNALCNNYNVFATAAAAKKHILWMMMQSPSMPSCVK